MEWYYEHNSKQYGPCSIKDIRGFVQAGRLTEDNIVWNKSMGKDWKQIKEIKELTFQSNLHIVKKEKKNTPKKASLSSDRLRAAAIQYGVVSSLEGGKNKGEVYEELYNKNLSNTEVKKVYHKGKAIRNKMYRRDGLGHIVLGIICIASGIIMTYLFPLLVAKMGLGILFYGLALFGIIELLNGLRFFLFGATPAKVWLPSLVFSIVAIGLATWWYLIKVANNSGI